MLALAALYETAHPFHSLVPREPSGGGGRTDGRNEERERDVASFAQYQGPRTREEAARLCGVEDIGMEGKQLREVSRSFL